MGYKNRTHSEKRVISPRKFSRIYDNNLDCAGVAVIMRDYNEGFRVSLQAVKVDNIIYATFACRKQNGSRLQTYCVRYNTDVPLDFVSFQPYPNHLVQKAVVI